MNNSGGLPKEGDFEKSEHFGSIETLELLNQVIGAIASG